MTADQVRSESLSLDRVATDDLNLLQGVPGRCIEVADYSAANTTTAGNVVPDWSESERSVVKIVLKL